MRCTCSAGASASYCHPPVLGMLAPSPPPPSLIGSPKRSVSAGMGHGAHGPRFHGAGAPVVFVRLALAGFARRPSLSAPPALALVIHAGVGASRPLLARARPFASRATGAWAPSGCGMARGPGAVMGVWGAAPRAPLDRSMRSPVAPVSSGPRRASHAAGEAPWSGEGPRAGGAGRGGAAPLLFDWPCAALKGPLWPYLHFFRIGGFHGVLCELTWNRRTGYGLARIPIPGARKRMSPPPGRDGLG